MSAWPRWRWRWRERVPDVTALQGSRTAPTLSVVLYYLLPAPYLGVALDSLVREATPDTEVVVVVGHEADTDPELPAHVRSRIDVLLQEPDRGAWDAANKGWRAARGRYVQFFMSDDLIPPGSIAATLAALDDAELYSGGMVFFDEQAGRRRTIRRRDGAPLTLERALGDLCSPGVIYRRDVLDRCGGFDGRFAFAHDRALLIDLCLAGARHETLPHDVCWMRVHPESRTLSHGDDVKLAYLSEHAAIAALHLARADLGPDRAAQIAAWRDEEMIKRAVIATLAGRFNDAATALPAHRWASSAWRVLARKALWESRHHLRRLATGGHIEPCG
jgi:glycosyltransferase involved in cell wall biosynthesis